MGHPQALFGSASGVGGLRVVPPGAVVGSSPLVAKHCVTACPRAACHSYSCVAMAGRGTLQKKKKDVGALNLLCSVQGHLYHNLWAGGMWPGSILLPWLLPVSMPAGENQRVYLQGEIGTFQEEKHVHSGLLVLCSCFSHLFDLSVNCVPVSQCSSVYQLPPWCKLLSLNPRSNWRLAT